MSAKLRPLGLERSLYEAVASLRMKALCFPLPSVSQLGIAVGDYFLIAELRMDGTTSTPTGHSIVRVVTKVEQDSSTLTASLDRVYDFGTDVGDVCVCQDILREADGGNPEAAREWVDAGNHLPGCPLEPTE